MSCASGGGEVRGGESRRGDGWEDEGRLCSAGSFVEASEFSCFFCDYFAELRD